MRSQGVEALKILHDAGVMMAYGPDLLGEMHRHQSEDFIPRGEVLPAIEVIRFATIDAAKVLRREGRLGVISPGAHADLVMVDGDPLADLSLLAGQGRHRPAIMKAGRSVKNQLDA